MGYDTSFEGKFEITPALDTFNVEVLNKFSHDRHEEDRFPSYYCDWVSTEDGTAIEWNGAEKFYDYVDWIKHLIQNFMIPWGRVLNGKVKWVGEDGDMGMIIIRNNDVKAVNAVITFPEE